jgi:hypothetical protein
MADIGKAIRTRLLSVSAVTDLVSTRIYPLTLPQGVTMPAVRYQRVSGNSDPHVTGTTGAATARLQFDIFANTYAGAEALRDAIREAIDQYTGTSSGVTIHSCNAAMHMDLFDEPVHGDAVGLYQMVSDYEIVHSETAL